MNLEQAVGNIDIVLQNAQMKRAEHEQVLNDLKLLVARAQLADKLEEELKEAKELISRMSPPPPIQDGEPEDIAVNQEAEETPEVPNENEVEAEQDERTE